MNANEVQKILVIGCGTMGRQICLQHVLFGYHVNLYDIDKDALKTAVSHIEKMAAGLFRQGYVSKEMVNKVPSLIFTTTDVKEASKDVQLVSENIPENITLKKKVWSEFSRYLPAEAIFTTKTSTLLPSMFAKASGRPERFLAWHFHLPAFTANITDVMPHPGTDPAITQIVGEHSKNIGQIPIDIHIEWPHYVYNEMLTALIGAAMRLIVNGVATSENIDRSWMVNMKTKIGPFGIMDSIGLDTTYHVCAEELAARPDTPYLQEIVEFLLAKVKVQELGRKTGKGFYVYPQPAYEQPDFADRVRPKYKE